jgi:hypothetical protein
VYDLQEHREEVMKTCGTLGVAHRVMEHLVATGKRPLDVSVDLVNDADLYIGIFGWRYGFIPEGGDCSITEMELRAAENSGMECLIFLSSDQHLWRADQMDTGENACKVQALRDYLSQRYTCKFFDSPSDLRAKVSEALTTAIRRRDSSGDESVDLARMQRDVDLRQCMSHLRELTELKTMHDALHRLEIECYKPMRVHLRRARRGGGSSFLIPLDAAFDLEMSVNALELVVDSLQDTLVQNDDLEAERSWVEELSEVRYELNRAVEEHEYGDVPGCYRQISRILQRQPQRLNARLTDEARSFSRSELVQRLREGDDSADSEEQRRDLRITLERLDELVAKHDAWQNMDFELRLFQYQTAENLEDSWPLILREAQIIYGEDVADWPQPLAKVHEMLATPMQERDSLRLNQQFLNFCALAGQHFDKVDQSLKMTCGRAVAAFSCMGDDSGSFGGDG